MILPVVVSQHAEEASFLWLLRSYGAGAPHFRLSDLSDVDERVEANLDGLRIAGEQGWAIANEQLSNGDLGEMFTACTLAFESGDPDRITQVLAAIEEKPFLSRAAIGALGWTAHAKAWPRIQDLLRSDSPLLRRVGIAASSVHRQDPGDALGASLRDDDASVRARALKAVGELGLFEHIYSVRDSWQDSDTECRFWAAWSGTLLGERSATLTLRRIADSESVRAERAAELAGRAAALPEASTWQRELSEDPTRRRLAIKVAGSIGDPIFVPWLLEQMAFPEFMRVAGESLSFITGIDIARDGMSRAKPDGFDPGANDDPKDENVEMEADQDLRYPNQELLQKWWTKRRSGLEPGIRHLLGQPVSETWSATVLRTGRQRQRAAAALELVLGNPGRPLFEVRAPAARQLDALA